MKLHEALRDLVRRSGREVLARSDLAALLARGHAFDSCPALGEVVGEAVRPGYVRDLYQRSLKGSMFWYREKAYGVRKAMAGNRRYWQAFIDYTVDSVSYALGLSGPIAAPFEPGFSYTSGYFNGMIFMLLSGLISVLILGNAAFAWWAASQIEWLELLFAFLFGWAAVHLFRSRR